MTRLRIFLVGILLLTVAALTATLVLGNEPILGLDLQGGVSVVLAPVGNPNSDSLDVAVDIIRNRVDALGVAEPEISRQGKNIVVDLPGVQDRDKAVLLVGQTAELRFRPVLAELPPESSSSTTTTTTTTPGSTTTTTATGTETTTSTTTPESAAHAAALDAIAKCQDSVVFASPSIPTTNRARDQRGACVVLPVRKTGNAKPSRLYLGPVNKVAGVDAPEGLTGDDVKSAKSSFQSGVGYVVDMKLKPDGAKKFDAMASALFGKTPPTDQVAIALDSIVQSHPQFQTSSFSGDVQISGGFTAQEADDLAKLITYGALPVTLERLTTQSISPSLGKDQLRAGLAAGLIGLALVAIYMLFYYRILGLVVILGLAVSGALIYCIISYLGKTAGLTLTIAGVTGLIVSVGVTVDSYVVYFERLKDEVRSGRSVRSSVDRGFQRSFRTIIAADLVSLLGAGVLYFLAIGSVRGFAFYLGLSTALDLVVAYFLMYPLVAMMARRPALVRMRHFGMGAALDAPELTA